MAQTARDESGMEWEWELYIFSKYTEAPLDSSSHLIGDGGHEDDTPWLTGTGCSEAWIPTLLACLLSAPDWAEAALRASDTTVWTDRLSDHRLLNDSQSPDGAALIRDSISLQSPASAGLRAPQASSRGAAVVLRASPRHPTMMPVNWTFHQPISLPEVMTSVLKTKERGTWTAELCPGELLFVRNSFKNTE